MEALWAFTGNEGILEEPGGDTGSGLAMPDGNTLQVTATPEPAVGFVGVKCVIRPHTTQENLSQVYRPQQLGNNGVRIPSFSLATKSLICHLAQEPPRCKDLPPGMQLLHITLSPG